jgi:hypothetical protein
MMDNKTFGIGVLFLTAVILLVANWMVPNRVVADTVVHRDFSVVTARVQGGGDALYVVDNRTQQMAVFTYDAGARNVRPRAVRPLSDAVAPQ